MSESDFIVTLPSNSNMSTNPTNEPSNYTVRLAEPLNLQGEWEAALVSVQYTPTWYAFTHSIKFHLFWVKAKTDTELQSETWTIDMSAITKDTAYASWVSTGEKLRAEAGKHGMSFADLINKRKIPGEMNYTTVNMYARYYDSVGTLGDAFCKTINGCMKPDRPSVNYEYDNVTKTGRLRIRGGYMYILQENYIKIAELLELSFQLDTLRQVSRLSGA